MIAKKKTDSKLEIWDWLVAIFLLLGLICGSILIYNWWTRRQKIARLKSQLAQKEQEAWQNYQEQKNYLKLTANLAKSPQIKAFFSDLLRNYAGKFARSKKLDISHYPLNFGGFYQRESQGQRPLKAQYRKFTGEKEFGRIWEMGEKVEENWLIIQRINFNY